VSKRIVGSPSIPQYTYSSILKIYSSILEEPTAQCPREQHAPRHLRPALTTSPALSKRNAPKWLKCSKKPEHAITTYIPPTYLNITSTLPHLTPKTRAGRSQDACMMVVLRLAAHRPCVGSTDFTHRPPAVYAGTGIVLNLLCPAHPPVVGAFQRILFFETNHFLYLVQLWHTPRLSVLVLHVEKVSNVLGVCVLNNYIIHRNAG
jgi:hypothetical protein